MDSIFGEEFAILLRELGCERFVVCEHERWLVIFCYDICHSEGFTATSDPKQRLVRQPVLEPLDQSCDRLRLIAGGSVCRSKPEGS